MATFIVTIRATVTKTYTVEDTTEERAVQQAHGLFTTNYDDHDEDYEQDTLTVEEIKK